MFAEAVRTHRRRLGISQEELAEATGLSVAVHWAHSVADRFPDGQLYVNLRGYDPDQPMDPGDALGGFLTGLGVTGQNVPHDLQERAARYRSELALRHLSDQLRATAASR